MRYLVPVGRVLFAAIFLLAVPGHFKAATVQYAAQHGAPMAHLSVPFTGVLCLLGGLSVALGFRAKWGGALIALFLVLITPIMHNYWAVKDPMQAMSQHTMFMKNLSMLGAALLLTYFGSGPVSVDELLSRRAEGKQVTA